MYFETYQVKDNIVYSVDMLRLKTELTYEEYTKLEFRIRTLYKDFIDYSYISTRSAGFHYNYHFKLEEGKTFWFGYLHNAESKNVNKTDKKYNFTIEFNPNKISISNKVLYDILSITHEWIVKSFDFAFDIKVNILDIIFDKKRKKTVSIIDNRRRR